MFRQWKMQSWDEKAVIREKKLQTSQVETQLNFYYRHKNKTKQLYEIIVQLSASLAHKCNQVGHGFMDRAAKHSWVQVFAAALHL